jgi:hypothetical protein
LTDDDINGIRSIYATRQRNVFSNFDAAVEGEASFASKGYFFYGFRYLRYDYSDDLPDPGYPLYIQTEWHELPAGFGFPRGIDAALNGQEGFAGKLYMFKGDQYVRYDWATDTTDPGYPKPIAGMWPGLPPDFTSGIQAAMNGRAGYEGKLYLFKGANYVRYDWAADRADPGYPLPIEFYWL